MANAILPIYQMFVDKAGKNWLPIGYPGNVH